MFGKKRMTYYDYFKKAQKSEKDVINEYKKYLKSKEKYRKVFDNHLENLSQLDKQFDNFNSFQKSFLDMFDGKIDGDSLRYAKPLLLQNYDMIDKYYTKKDIIQFHLVRQFLYIIYANFPPQHRLLIRSVDFNNITSPNDIELIIKTVDGTRTTYHLEHDQYHINAKATISQIKESLMRVKGYKESNKKTKTKEYDILVPLEKSIVQKSINKKSIKMVDKNLPIIPPLPGQKSMKSSKRKSSKKKSSRKSSLKKISQKKELKNVDLPVESPILPVFEIELPGKKA